MKKFDKYGTRAWRRKKKENDIKNKVGEQKRLPATKTVPCWLIELFTS